MKCPKCNGLMYTQSLLALYLISEAWRCRNCGSLINHVIHEDQNRYSEPYGISGFKELKPNFLRKKPSFVPIFELEEKKSVEVLVG